MSFCFACDAGKRSERTNKSEACIACTTGRFQPSKGEMLCEPCPAGFYTSAEGQTLCTSCDPSTLMPPTTAQRQATLPPVRCARRAFQEYRAGRVDVPYVLEGSFPSK